MRILAFASFGSGLWYLWWRYTASLNMSQWWYAIPLVLAETYSFIDGALFSMAIWRSERRSPTPSPLLGRDVDVLITTYNEPVDLVMRTATAALAISYPHQTYVLDDGNRAELADECREAGVGYIVRSPDWANRPLHAKAGNLNNALMVTTGEFMLILDADQVPDPSIIDHTLGYFADPRVALVQTPQYFENVPKNDPLGSQASLFYGPIMRGKDGWNAAFFCGSNAVLRREALMQLALTGYVRDVGQALSDNLRTARKVVSHSRRRYRDEPAIHDALNEISHAVEHARRRARAGVAISEVTYEFQQRVHEVSKRTVASDLEQIRRDLEELADEPDAIRAAANIEIDEQVLDELVRLDVSPLDSMVALSEMVERFDVDRGDAAQPLMPLATISVTEDMATAMRIHAMGWLSVYHDEILARGLAPENLRAAMGQRLRWSQGTLQVFLRENPLFQRGLSVAQRLQYLATMWNYLSGFAQAVFVAGPVVYLLANALPVHAFGFQFLEHLLPYYVVNFALFSVAGKGHRTWRGQQYNFALFPLWIRAAVATVANVYFRRPLSFYVTPKVNERESRAAMAKIVWPQLAAMGLLVASTIVGFIKLATHHSPSALGVWLNVVWVAFDVIMMSVVIRAVNYQGFEVANE